jgi:hypothetical protein
MAIFNEAWADREIKRWMRPDAHRFLRPDWRRFWLPGHENDPLYRFYETIERKYSPDQPRVPAGSREGGQWTDEGGDAGDGKPTRVRLASSDKPRLGRSAAIAIAAEIAKRVIAAFRSENGLYDLFGRKDGTVSYTELNGKVIFGSNSTSPTYEARDRTAADDMRDALIKDYPREFDDKSIGQMPNNALYHAETTALLRAARENGGSLSGQTLDVHVDNPMCNNCYSVLPYVGLKLGNPTVTFIDPNNVVNTMRDGRWIDKVHP